MSRTVPKADGWSRLNALHDRVARIERQKPTSVAAGKVATLTTPSASPVTAGAPSASFVIGASGDAIVYLSATISTPAGSFADVSLSLDGGSFLESITSGSSAADLTVGNALVMRLSDLFDGLVSPGQHTLQAALSASAGVAVSATFFSLVVVPI